VSRGAAPGTIEKETVMSIVFYAAPQSSASPVTCALAELGVPHERVQLNLAEGDQRKPEYLELNPNGKVPLLVVDGTPLFEALAILQWLGDRFGVEKKLWPALNDPKRLEALSWTAWGYASYAPAVVRVFYASSERIPAEQRNAAAAAVAQQDVQTLLGVLDGRLSKRPYVLGSAFSLADLVLASAVRWSSFGGISLDAHRHVQDWLGRVTSRPSLSTPGA
jgi:glutathione S-transferase